MAERRRAGLVNQRTLGVEPEGSPGQPTPPNRPALRIRPRPLRRRSGKWSLPATPCGSVASVGLGPANGSSRTPPPRSPRGARSEPLPLRPIGGSGSADLGGPDRHVPPRRTRFECRGTVSLGNRGRGGPHDPRRGRFAPRGGPARICAIVGRPRQPVPEPSPDWSAGTVHRVGRRRPRAVPPRMGHERPRRQATGVPLRQAGGRLGLLHRPGGTFGDPPALGADPLRPNPTGHWGHGPVRGVDLDHARVGGNRVDRRRGSGKRGGRVPVRLAIGDRRIPRDRPRSGRMGFRSRLPPRRASRDRPPLLRARTRDHDGTGRSASSRAKAQAEARP